MSTELKSIPIHITVKKTLSWRLRAIERNSQHKEYHPAVEAEAALEKLVDDATL
jgi:hypothetical protein